MSSTQRKWITSASPQSISIYTCPDEEGRFHHSSTASASRVGNIWWVDRVKVHEQDHGKGLGRALVRMLQVSLVENHDLAEGPLVAQVCPGGYDTPRKIQRNFYLSCGFKIVKDEPELTMEWSPCPRGNTKSNTKNTPSESRAG